MCVHQCSALLRVLVNPSDVPRSTFTSRVHTGTAFPSAAMADAGTGVGPRDAAVIEAILREMGVEDFEPNVIHQMLEFSYS